MPAKTNATNPLTSKKAVTKPGQHFKKMMSDTFITTSATLDVVKTEVSNFNRDQKIDAYQELLDNGYIDEAEFNSYKSMAISEFISRVH